MDEFKVGDKVKAEHADGRMIVGTAAEVSESGDWMTFRRIPFTLRLDDWSVSLVERAQPELPTEEGIYFPRKTFQPGTRIVKLQDGEWCNSDGTPFNDDDDGWLWLVFKRGDLTKFEPVADTARKVLDAVIARTTMHCNACSGHLADIRKEFGVTS